MAIDKLPITDFKKAR